MASDVAEISLEPHTWAFMLSTAAVVSEARPCAHPWSSMSLLLPQADRPCKGWIVYVLGRIRYWQVTRLVGSSSMAQDLEGLFFGHLGSLCFGLHRNAWNVCHYITWIKVNMSVTG